MTKQQLMTEDEIHDFGVEVVFGQLKKDGYEILSVNTDRTMNPQIVAKKDGERAFIVVRTACYPNKGVMESEELAFKMIDHADKNGAICYFASVGIVNAEGQNDEEMSRPVKGAGFQVSYEGLLTLTLSNRVKVLGEPSDDT